VDFGKFFPQKMLLLATIFYIFEYEISVKVVGNIFFSKKTFSFKADNIVLELNG